MNIVFMGSPDFAVPGLEKLYNEPGITIKAVVTQPDRKKGRGHKLRPTPVKQMAHKLGLKVLQTDNINREEFITNLRDLSPEAIVVVAFGQKLGKKVLELPSYGCINLHASLLPRYRGASPIHRAIINGDKVTGVTTMYMDEGWDTGDIIYKKEVKINREDTAGTLHDKLASIGGDLLVKTLNDIEKGVAPREKQSEDKASYAYKIDRKIGELDWSRSSEDIFNLVRGVNPWPGAYTTWKGKLLKIWWVEPLKLTVTENDKKMEAGEVITASQEDGIIVKTGDDAVKIIELQLAGRKKITADKFVLGYNIKEGDKLG
ncbi:methionyl-tRNA formyltransferase [Halothermothrix orenii]|uniref:Methionyl-tRNA formyltransferase n=1 Tax=Halothermothrix orenii (strain H 168 / OCM 544 / DSM 9562) TaxID=373903 RepID=FMT_HALOH|nr:methionyl-tRNA formyltransferase [Halothermothrix orenii]B8CWS7.1 RecName: Full=Methionyl-tRNA formyltransferase [Halothermothrix orenii H 168]ACL69746.1 methionyl-tRNA formyltransferase [Halothermothrix orenii H 168]